MALAVGNILVETKVVYVYFNYTMDPFSEDCIEMFFYENRLKTFEGWPFEENCSCTPENVSKNG